MAVRNSDTTLYVGNLDPQVDDELLYELMLQAAPVVSIHIPRDRTTQRRQGYGFVEFRNLEDAEYAASLMANVRLFDRPIRINRSLSFADAPKITAKLYVGNLDPLVNEPFLQSTFSVFGRLATAPDIARDESGASKGYAFVQFDSFEIADSAIAAMNGQYLMNRPCTVEYAIKNSRGERHGDASERALAVEASKNSPRADSNREISPSHSKGGYSVHDRPTQLHQRGKMRREPH